MDHPFFDNTKGADSYSESEETSAQTRAQNLGLPYVNLKNYKIAEDVLKLLPISEAQEYRLIPYAIEERVLRVASVSLPSGPAKTRLVRLEQQSGYEIEVSIVSPGSLNKALNAFAQIDRFKTETAQTPIEPLKFDALKTITSLDQVKELAPKSNTSDLFDIFLAGAIVSNASDIHLEPGPDQFSVRYRLDGILYHVLDLPIIKLVSLTSRIKILAHLRLDLHDAPQDGSFLKKFNEKLTVDFRISILPTQYGESLAIRIIRSDRGFIPLGDLGFSITDQERIEQSANSSQGTVIVSGPTGSGKTTTLYAILQLIKSENKKIITLEDPIEYRIEGIQQSQINEKANYRFSVGLKEVLRQDPDIIMVGEVRDRETAETTFEAAMTSHLVLTTMHATSALQTFTRLIDLGVKSNLLNNSINLIINQRLVRRICQNCQGKGCSVCHLIGYQGRIVLAETLIPSFALIDAVVSRQSFTVWQEEAAKSGISLITEDSRKKIKEGITTEEEVKRVLI